ncbi:(2Fe-2S)-binding protein [Effusibacillus consociatus]|uniref:(2Fe-2S)-binding protein n=1 Tax=Effusibacillus consociatus TaxID=1117041 RepID=A0ABV9Q096_9BACL
MAVNKPKSVGTPTHFAGEMTLRLTVNQQEAEIVADPTRRLADILRENLGLTGTKLSCEIGRCGACTVVMNEKPVNSCLVLAYQADGSVITTIEGLSENGLHPIQKAFLEEGGFQCGYCTPGMIMAAKALLDENPEPDQEQILEALSGNLCRCTGYASIVRAIKRCTKDVVSKGAIRYEIDSGRP